jgi:Flp pilus assembly pilin Flp
LLRFSKRDRGATATEYAIVIAVIAIAIAIVVGAIAFGTSLNGWYADIAGNLP